MESLDRIRFVKCALTIAGGLVLCPSSVIAQTILDYPSATTAFPWKKGEVLFGEGAGFQEARENKPLGIFLERGIDPNLVLAGMSSWNELMKRFIPNDLFKLEEDQTKAKIAIKVSSKNFTTNKPDYKSVYISSIIDLASIQPPVIAHELGHALFIPRGTMFHNLVNYQFSDLPDKPIHSVMVLDGNLRQRPLGWIGEDDQKLLKVAGYV